MRPAPYIVLLLLLAVSPASGAHRYVDTGGTCGGNLPCYTTLQAAIDASAAGDVIHVQPGHYVLGARVDVHTSVRILGPQAGVNPLPSNGTTRTPGNATTEAVFDGGGTLPTLLRITAADVELNGLEFHNGTGDLIDSPATPATSGTILRNNIIHGSSGDEGVQLRNVSSPVVECNHVYGTAGDGINVCCGSSNALIRYNEVHDVASPDAAVYVYGSTSTTIDANLVYNSFSNEGIKLGAKSGADAAGTGGTISSNRIHDVQQDGIAVYMSYTTVTCNEIYGSTSENGGIYLAFAIANVSITDNDLHDNTYSTIKWGDPGAIMIGTAVDAATVTVANNRLVDNQPNGMTNKAAALLVAENNWWGDASGPGPVGPGSGARVSTNIDYDPWLLSAPSPNCAVPGPCGQPPVGVEPRTWSDVKTIYRD